MATRGLFSVQSSSVDEAFDTLVGACGELKAKLNNIDTLEHEIDGKSRTTWMTWGRKFHARVIKDSSGIHVEVYDLGFLPSDLFIKELYNTLKKYASASPLAVDHFVKVFHATRKGDMRFSGDERTMRMEESGTPMPGGGAPAIVANIPGQVSDTTEASFVNKRICEKCGYNSMEETPFCTRCGTQLD